MVSIVSLVHQPEHLSVQWSDGGESTYPWIWLRDHDHDAATLHPITKQRRLWSASLSITMTAASAVLAAESIEITWLDGSGSTLPTEFLRRHRAPCRADSRVEIEPVLWDRASIEPAPLVAYDEIIDTDDGLLRWLHLVAEYGFCIAADTPATAGATLALVRRVGYVRETIFGGFWEFTDDLDKADMAYTNLELRPHTDGTYSHDAPGLQLLHCLEFDGVGGESIAVDGFRLAAHLREHAPQHYATLCRVMIPGQYLGDGSHLVATRPVFRLGDDGDVVQVSFNNADRAPFLLEHDEMLNVYAALQAFDLLANDDSLQWRHVLRPGEALLFDNWRVLHGRAAYSGRRRLCGAYVNHEDFESRLRMAGPAMTAGRP